MIYKNMTATPMFMLCLYNQSAGLLSQIRTEVCLFVSQSNRNHSAIILLV